MAVCAASHVQMHHCSFRKWLINVIRGHSRAGVEIVVIMAVMLGQLGFGSEAERTPGGAAPSPPSRPALAVRRPSAFGRRGREADIHVDYCDAIYYRVVAAPLCAPSFSRNVAASG